MKSINGVAVEVKLNKEQRRALKKALAHLPDFHIGKLFGNVCIQECDDNDGAGRVIMPLAVVNYITEPGNAFDIVPGLVSSLVKQAEKREKINDFGLAEYGGEIKCLFFSGDVEKMREIIDSYPEYHVVRSYLETGLNALRDEVCKVMSGKSQGSEALGADKIPNVSVSYLYYAFNELFDEFSDVDDEMLYQICGRKRSCGIDILK